ncbi:hypothetical protein [Paenibacillus sp. XY044]|uniref:hypothetical protein n=1 Tax=Paenibacillus sp. XY044 TaxID=2026089 RepID=UPI000B988A74|nr:hypothetical protein [Paenibacillus sp. XY044]OZB91763.1 hypothetical protein CJP46_27425 [Paenibacillus sp. XY044]
MKQLVIALFRTRQDAALAISALWERRFDKKDVSLLALDKRQLSIICRDTGLKEPVSRHGTSGLFGEIRDLTSSLTMRDQITWASGPAAAKLGGAEVGGKNDGLVVSLVGIGVPVQDAENYEKLLIQGNFMVIVECSKERSIEAQHVLEDHKCVETK